MCLSKLFLAHAVEPGLQRREPRQARRDPLRPEAAEPALLQHDLLLQQSRLPELHLQHQPLGLHHQAAQEARRALPGLPLRDLLAAAPPLSQDLLRRRAVLGRERPQQPARRQALLQRARLHHDLREGSLPGQVHSHLQKLPLRRLPAERHPALLRLVLRQRRAGLQGADHAGGP